MFQPPQQPPTSSSGPNGASGPPGQGGPGGPSVPGGPSGPTGMNFTGEMPNYEQGNIIRNREIMYRLIISQLL